MKMLNRIRWWVVRLLVPQGSVYFGAGEWEFGGTLQLKLGQRMIGNGATFSVRSAK